MKNTKVKTLTRSAMLVAIALVFQNLRLLIGTGIHTQFIIGSLVNLSLIVGVGLINIYAGIAVALITPIVAYLQLQLPPIFPYLIPIVALGNIIIVYVFYLFKEKNKYIGVVAGALAKFLFLWAGVTAMLKLVQGNVPQEQFNKVAPVLSVNFSWPQLVTALIGGFLAIALIKVLSKSIKETNI